MKKKAAGRPPLPEKRKLRAVYMTDAEYKKCEAKAGRIGFSPWAASVLLEVSSEKRSSR